jgi:hypothetical protein
MTMRERMLAVVAGRRPDRVPFVLYTDLDVPDMLAAWPRMRVALNFPSSVHLRPVAEIRERARALLAAGAASGRLQLQISENMPPGVWRTNVPLLIEAVERWGNL